MPKILAKVVKQLAMMELHAMDKTVEDVDAFSNEISVNVQINRAIMLVMANQRTMRILILKMVQDVVEIHVFAHEIDRITKIRYAFAETTFILNYWLNALISFQNGGGGGGGGGGGEAQQNE